MDIKQAYLQVLSKANRIALATAVGTMPNVRIVNFCFDADRLDVLYFASDRSNQKVEELRENEHIAFTTIPDEGIEHARSNHAIVLQSKRSIADLSAAFTAKIPGYDETIAAIGDTLDVFEIHTADAFVILDFETAGPVAFSL